MKYKRGSNPIFTHTAIMGGFVPVYTNLNYDAMEARWWWAEYLMDFMDFMVWRGYSPSLKITGEK